MCVKGLPAMFDRCDFLMGDGNVVMVLRGKLPLAEHYTIAATPDEIRIKAGQNEIASFSYKNDNAFNALQRVPQIGIVEFPEGGVFENAITNLAYVQTMILVPA